MAAARVLSGAIVLTMLVHAGALSAQDDDVPLRPSAGAYRGLVVDDRTDLPLPSAAVIILWQRPDDEIQGLRRLSAAREAFTDEKGEFVYEVTALEQRLAPKSFAPRIVIFRPGYAPLPGTPRLFPPGVAAGRFAEAGAVVRLVPVTGYEERAEAFNTFIAMLSAAQLFPPTDLPETSELIRVELESLGARPMKPAVPGAR
ncbi:MAG TPA: hypothetical protein VLK28_00485 [Methylomirabilota bacterium]|nr:hypothetical protein [Methylomirabilota bacterium]